MGLSIKLVSADCFMGVEEALMHRKNPGYFRANLTMVKGQILHTIELGRSLGPSFFHEHGKSLLALLDFVLALIPSLG